MIIYRMNCNSFVHDEMEEIGEIICPFCDSQLKYIEKKTDEILLL